LASKRKLSPEYQLLKGIDVRKKYDQNLGEAYGRKAVLEARKYLDDYLLVNLLSDEDFQDFVDRHKLFIVGYRPSRERWNAAEVYIKSKNGKEYRKHLNQMLYHPPNIDFNSSKAKSGELYLDHIYEGRSLYARYIKPVLIGLEFLAERPVKLETTEYERIQPKNWWEAQSNPKQKKVRVLYTCEKRKVSRAVLGSETAPPYYES
ncbi:MAG: hypothetical protein AAB930_00775, partial [Patescibacteria group bacterium]